MLNFTRTAVFIILLLLSTQSPATLIDRGNGLIYDDVLDITWLQDANYAATSGFSNQGLLGWSDALGWADGLSFGGFDDWRLASVDVNQDGTILHCPNVGETACRDNELGYMFYHNLQGINGVELTDFGPFINVKSHYFAREDDTQTNAWLFNMHFGFQGTTNKVSGHWAWAVRNGDVSVPEPIGIALLLPGLFGIYIRRFLVTH